MSQPPHRTSSRSERRGMKIFHGDNGAMRLLLSVLLCYAVYTETGIWTTIFCILSTLSIETVVSILKQIKVRLKELEDGE